jgi:serine/threonine protein kinase
MNETYMTECFHLVDFTDAPHEDDWQIRYRIIKGICEGLHCIHKEGLTHLDIKPENVLLDAHMDPKIIDFGLSRFMDKGKSRVITQNKPGTP